VFKIIARKGFYCPRICCTNCGEPIVDASNAVVIYPKDVDEGDVLFYVAHKGGCDRTLTEMGGDAGGTTELTTALAWMLQNAGIKTPEDVDRAFTIADMTTSL